jgi:phage gpG-like protein
MDITIKGLDGLGGKFDPDKWRRAMLMAMQSTTLGISAYVKERGLSGQVLHIRTGRLKSSINGTAQMVGNIVTGKVGTNVVYAPIHELGGVIRAKNSPYLRFKIGDRWVSKKEVKIPARPFLSTGLQMNVDNGYIIETFQKRIKQLLDEK